jgi:coniferyl-aldehyde dehydrogenase
MGHRHGHDGFKTFSNLKPVFIQAKFNATSLLHPPYGKAMDWLLKFIIGK